MAPIPLRNEIRKRPWLRAGYVRQAQPGAADDNAAPAVTDVATTQPQATATSLGHAAASFAHEKQRREDEEEADKDKKVQRTCGCRTRCNKYGVLAGWPCRYEDAYCSCKLGAPDQGRCWDRIAGSLGFCRQRPCARGWTCACAGRSHLCARAPQSVNTVEADVERLPEAPCTQQVVYQVTKPTLRLGSFLPALSASGMARDECSQFTWWHNGLLRGDWGLVGGVMDENKTATALSERGVHTLLELRPGDLLAFQFTQASYYCYKSFSAIMVNGLNITTDMPGVATHYARQATPNWFGPAYVIDESNTAADESDTDLTKWLKPRTKMLVDNAAIVPGRDLWQRDLGGSDDTRTADWFWRVQIPRDLPDPQTASF